MNAFISRHLHPPPLHDVSVLKEAPHLSGAPSSTSPALVENDLLPAGPLSLRVFPGCMRQPPA